MDAEMESKKEHKCYSANHCICSISALEPEDNCAIHGHGNWPPRCNECGKFLPRKAKENQEKSTKTYNQKCEG